MHFSTETLVENMWIEDLLEQQARMFRVGWKTI